MQLALARALAYQGKLVEADRHFRDAYSTSAPDARVRFDALNAHADFLSDDPTTIEVAISLTREALKADPKSHPYHQAAYRFCCLLICEKAQTTLAKKYCTLEKSSLRLTSQWSGKTEPEA